LKKISFVFIVLSVALLLQGCGLLDLTYDIKVKNLTDSDFSVYLDGEYMCTLSSGQSKTIKNVSEGTHTLEAIDEDDFVIAERTFDLDNDLEWTVYTSTYDIKIKNLTGSDFSVYLDGEYQFEVYAGGSRTIKGVSEGTHIIEAREDDFVIATRTLYVDSDIEWTVHEE